MVPREELAEYLVAAGLEPSPAGGDAWQGRCEGAGRLLPIHVRLSENWLFFSIRHFMKAPADAEARAALFDELLRLNHDLELAKFCLDAEGDVVLTVELPTENVDSSEVREAVEALARCARRHSSLGK